MATLKSMQNFKPYDHEAQLKKFETKKIPDDEEDLPYGYCCFCNLFDTNLDNVMNSLRLPCGHDIKACRFCQNVGVKLERKMDKIRFYWMPDGSVSCVGCADEWVRDIAETTRLMPAMRKLFDYVNTDPAKRHLLKWGSKAASGSTKTTNKKKNKNRKQMNRKQMQKHQLEELESSDDEEGWELAEEPGTQTPCEGCTKLEAEKDQLVQKLERKCASLKEYHDFCVKDWEKKRQRYEEKEKSLEGRVKALEEKLSGREAKELSQKQAVAKLKEAISMLQLDDNQKKPNNDVEADF